ncbi:hypothetical protein ACC754_44400, partial [Rhizobium johnstonii]
MQNVLFEAFEQLLAARIEGAIAAVIYGCAAMSARASDHGFSMVMVSASMRLRKVWMGGSSSFNPPSSEVSDRPVMLS